MHANIFDTETNGVIKNWNLPLNKNNLENFPRISQLAWQRCDLNTGEVVSEYQSIIYPDGWTIPTVEELIAQKNKNPTFFVDNNISTERCFDEGRPIAEILELIINDLFNSEIAVAHNMKFDMNVLGAELMRADMQVGKKLIKVCTMDSTINLCKLPPFRYGTYKYPKLVELYKFLFGKEMKGNHDAFADVIGCRECFMQLIKLKYLTF